MPREIHVDFSKMTDAEAEKFLKENKIGLKVSEARKIEEQILKRPPTMTELVIWGIQGSEHSSYKSSKKYLRMLPTEGPTVILGPKEDSGVAYFCDAGGKKFGLVLSHESHNHPSQVVPYEGAATGVGGIVRDIACMGAKVVGCLDMLRFGEIDRNATKLIVSGVVGGIGGYGNPLGVPNIGGDAFFHKSFNENCLVNVASVGIVEEDKIIHSYVPQNAKNEPYEFIIVGKPTDRSGFGGASFASADLDEKDKESNKGAVQEPNPFLERHLLASFYDLFDKLVEMDELENVGFKDMGAGGNLCATIELAESAGFGAEIIVENIHVAEENLPSAIILCSETQERFCFAVPKRLTEYFLTHFNETWGMPDVSAGAKASMVGKVTHDGIYRAIHNGDVVCEAKASDITEGLTVDREVKNPNKKFDKVEIDFSKIDYSQLLTEFLQRENLASLEPFYENYDQTVQGITVLERSQAEAVVQAPLRDHKDLTAEEKKQAYSASCSGNSRIGEISPYSQGAHAVLSAIQKLAAVGAKTVALTDCLCYGSPEVPTEMWEFAEGIRGISEAARNLYLHSSLTKTHCNASLQYPTPFVSGNVSLYNRGTKGSVNPTVTICGFGILDNEDLARKNYFQKTDNEIWLVGERNNSLGGSEIAAHFGQIGSDVPEIDFEKALNETNFVIDTNLIESAAVIQEGGLLVALAKMAMRAYGFGNTKIGFECDLSKFKPEELFSEFDGFILEVDPNNSAKLEKFAKERNVQIQKIGKVSDNGNIKADLQNGKINLKTTNVSEFWKNALRKKLG